MPLRRIEAKKEQRKKERTKKKKYLLWKAQEKETLIKWKTHFEYWMYVFRGGMALYGWKMLGLEQLRFNNNMARQQRLCS